MDDRRTGKTARFHPGRALAVAAGKTTGLAVRLSGRGGGTALPGLVATRLAPDIVCDLSAQLPHGSVVVSGTNGKTTASRMLAQVLADLGLHPVRNHAGSNLMRGLASALVAEVDFLGTLRTGKSIGVFEVDEAALPEVLANVRPTFLLLLDLFRDQLDRYGEVATVARLWKAAIARMSPSMVTIANADDPLVAEVVESARSAPRFFGVESVQDRSLSREHASDVKACPRCGGSIQYSFHSLGHLGHYHCPNCHFHRPTPSVSAREVSLRGVEGSSFLLSTPNGEARVHLPIPGLYNVYNAVAAAAAAHGVGATPAQIATSLARVTPAFGRMETLDVDGRQVVLALAKNPAGFNEVLRTVGETSGSLHLMVMLSDNIADGRDVSWIWDTDVEMLQNRVATVVFSGTRAEDMALRFKYAGIVEIEGGAPWSLDHRIEPALRRALSDVTPGDRLFIIPTYTALLDIRKALTRLGYARPYWQE